MIIYVSYGDATRCESMRVFYHHSRLPRSRKRPDVAKVRIRAPIASVLAFQIRSFSCDEFVTEVWVTVWGWMGEACWYFVWLHELIHIHMTHTTWRSKVGGYKDTQGRLIVYWKIDKQLVRSWIAIVQIGRVFFTHLKGRTWKDGRTSSAFASTLFASTLWRVLEDFTQLQWCATAAIRAFQKDWLTVRYRMIQQWHVMACKAHVFSGEMFLMASFGIGSLAWLGKADAR